MARIGGQSPPESAACVRSRPLRSLSYAIDAGCYGFDCLPLRIVSNHKTGTKAGTTSISVSIYRSNGLLISVGRVAELADAKDLGSFGAILAGSTPVAPTKMYSGLRPEPVQGAVRE